MIVGFPGETVSDFEETLSLAKTVRYHSMFSFKYSERPNTLASKRQTDDVAESEKTRRIVSLQQLQKNLQAEIHKRSIGSTVEVLVDSTSRKRSWELAGRTSGNTVVNFEASKELLGCFAQVQITKSGPFSLHGKLVQTTVKA